MKKKFPTLARQQQARFRETLPLPARTPTDEKGLRHGHLLALGYEYENLYPSLKGSQGAMDFFESRQIKWWRNSCRSGDQKGKGPTRNLASSQIACVNFLLPIAKIPGALITFLRSIDDDIKGVETIIDRMVNSSPVEFEWVGWKEPLECGSITRGAYQTSVDAFIVANIPNGLRAYLFEWKYSEEYLNPEDQGKGKSGDTRRRRYKGLYESADSPFNQSTPFDEYLYEPFYQVMRLFLLANRMLKEGVTPSIKIQEAKVIVVCPSENIQYRQVVRSIPLAKRFHDLTTVEEVVRATLKNPNDFSIVAPESIISDFRDQESINKDSEAWLNYHALRYGW